MRLRFWMGWLGMMVGAVVQAAAEKPAKLVAFLADPNPGRAVRHGQAELGAALAGRGWQVHMTQELDGPVDVPLLVAGVAGRGGPLDRLLFATGTAAPIGAEGLLIKRVSCRGRPVWWPRPATAMPMI